MLVQGDLLLECNCHYLTLLKLLSLSLQIDDYIILYLIFFSFLLSGNLSLLDSGSPKSGQSQAL